MAKRKKPRSAAQKAATRKMLAALRAKKGHAAPKAKVKRRRSKRRKSVALGKRHRPVVRIRKGRLYRSKRSKLIRRHATFANPFLGNIAVLGGNPMKRRRKSHRKSHRRSHRRSRSLFANPLPRSLSAVTAGPREMVSGDFLKEAASLSVGFVAPNLLLPMLPMNWRDARWKVYASKVGLTSAVAAVAGAVTNKRVAKAILLGGGMSILLDAYADFVVPALGGAAPSLRDGVDAYYGEPTGGVDAYYGEPTNVGLSDSEYGNPY